MKPSSATFLTAACLALSLATSAASVRVDFAAKPASIEYSPFYDKFELALQLQLTGGQGSTVTGMTLSMEKAMEGGEFGASVMARLSSSGTVGQLVFLCSSLLRCLQIQTQLATRPAFLQQAVMFAPFGLQGGVAKQFPAVRSATPTARMPPVLEDGKVVFQRHVDNSLSFAGNWDAYVRGFQDVNGNYWLGLEKLTNLTKGRSCKLYFEGTNFNGTVLRSVYKDFQVLGAEENYRLRVGEAEPGSQLAAMEHENDSEFSAADRDNDKSAEMFCAKVYGSGWWFNNCHHHNPNGLIGSRANWTSIDKCFQYCSSLSGGAWVCLMATKLSFACSS